MTARRAPEGGCWAHPELPCRVHLDARLAGAHVIGDRGASIKAVVQKGLGERARLAMVVHPLLESQFFAAVGRVGRWTSCPRRRAIRGIVEGFV